MTPRLILRSASTAQAERIVAGLPMTTDPWAPDFPCADAVSLATMFLLRDCLGEAENPFGLYLIERRNNGAVVGGIDFKGKPRAGVVEIGYALARSSRGSGFAAESAEALVELSRGQRLARVLATTTSGNPASQRTLERAGFTCVETCDGPGSGHQDAEHHYAVQLQPSLCQPAPPDSEPLNVSIALPART